ncbi:unnamed protein product [Phytophthora lilii]|uniref:Unnamed protein product n=1 Tax=Phytophthora lilii TaxID=2077276 RepID=A0A9W6WSC7_9STRA|nr:unnamed protein product [Phytophthora lilii]
MGISFLRVVLKRMIWRVCGCLQDISTDVAVCAVEIFGSLFQNVCLQNARSPSVSVLIIVTDFIQAIIETNLYIEHKFVVNGRHTMQTAVKILEGTLNLDAGKRKKLSKPQLLGSAATGLSGTSTILSPLELHPKPLKIPTHQCLPKRASKIVAASKDRVLKAEVIYLNDFPQDTNDKEAHNNPVLPGAGSSTSFAPAPLTQIDDVEIPHRHHAKLLSQALRLVFASEVLVFAEYAEFACSVLYGLYTALLYRLPYAKYNFFLARLPPDQFRSSIANSFTYAALEGVTMLLLFQLVRAKYGVSTFHQLAFVLEKYWMSVQGKLVGSLALLFLLGTIHQGTDLTLAFNWDQMNKS